jgi:hypothetical protein
VALKKLHTGFTHKEILQNKKLFDLLAICRPPAPCHVASFLLCSSLHNLKEPRHQLPLLGLHQQIGTPLTHLPVDPQTSTVQRPCCLDVLVIQVPLLVAYQSRPKLRPTGGPGKPPAIPIIAVVIVLGVVLVVIVSRLGVNPIVSSISYSKVRLK